jgi:hypothetical protein
MGALRSRAGTLQSVFAGHAQQSALTIKLDQ